jgi:hypothetical protein
MPTVGKLYNDGTLEIAGEFNERLPTITTGLVAHFPLDGKGGTFDGVGGYQPIQNTLKDVNLIEAMTLNWRDPKSWQVAHGSTDNVTWDDTKQAIKIVGTNYVWLKTPIIVDVNKHYLITAEVYQETDTSASNVLYLGGHGLTQLGVKYTTNYDYTISSNYNVPEGSWIKVGTNRYGIGNNPIGGNGSGGVTVGPIGWTGPNGLCYKYYFGGLFNYSGIATDAIYIRNIQIQIIDNDNSNCIINTDGVYIEDETTNIYPGPDTKGKYMVSGYNGIEYGLNTPLTNIQWCVDNINQPIFGVDVMKVSRINSGVNQRVYVEWTHMISKSGVVLLPNEERTVSFYYFGTYGTSLSPYISSVGNIRLFADNALSGNGSLKLTIPCKVNEWQRITFRVKNIDTTNSTFNWGWLVLHAETETCILGNNECWKFTAVQVERKSFPTAYLSGTRSSGSLTIPIQLTAPYTICFEFTPSVTNVYSNTVNWVLSNNPYTDYDFIFFKRPTEDYYRMRVVATASDFLFSPTDIMQGINYKVALVATTTTTLVYLNGVYKGIIPYAFNITGLNLGHSESNGPGNNKFKKLSIYNRVLYSAEIYKLTNNNSPISKSGNITGIELIEHAITIPSDVYHFPLDIDNKDKHRILSASQDLNTIHENGAVWVGNSITNLADKLHYSLGSGATSTQVSMNDMLSRIHPDAQVFGCMKTNSLEYTRMYVSRTTGLLPTSTYSISVYVWVDVPKTDTVSQVYLREHSTSNTNGVLKTYLTYNGKILKSCDLPQKTWIKMEAVGQIPVVDYTYWGICIYLYLANSKVFMTNVQANEKVFNPPSVTTDTGLSALDYNFNRDLGLDWSADWTICYFKKPIGTSNDNSFGGYNIESLGGSTNALGGGYHYFGKETGVNGYKYATPWNAGDPYFNEWHMVSIQKTGTIATIKYFTNYGVYIGTFTTSNTVANYYVTTDGYDFKLGGWDNGNPCNAYFKDLLVAKRRLSDTELETIFKRTMSISKSKLRLGNALRPNLIL